MPEALVPASSVKMAVRVLNEAQKSVFVIFNVIWWDAVDACLRPGRLFPCPAPLQLVAYAGESL